MNSISLCSFHLVTARKCQLSSCLPIRNHQFCSYQTHFNAHCLSFHSPLFISTKLIPLCSTESNVDTTVSSNEGYIPVMDFEEFIEKDWSLLDPDKSGSEVEFNRNVERIISAGKIEETSRVLVSIGSEGFADQLVRSSPCSLLLLVHDSLLILACVKEKYDKVKCWQGEIIYVPEKWSPLDVVFLYFLPALPHPLDQIFEALAERCSPGARVVISHPQGRKVFELQKQQYPEVAVSDLREKAALQSAASAHFFELVEFVDEPGFYLAVLSFSGTRNSE